MEATEITLPSTHVLSGFLDEESAGRLSLSVPKAEKRRLDKGYEGELRKAVQDELRLTLEVAGEEQTVAQIMAHLAVADYIAKPSVFKLNAFLQSTGEASVKIEMSNPADGLADVVEVDT